MCLFIFFNFKKTKTKEEGTYIRTHRQQDGWGQSLVWLIGVELLLAVYLHLGWLAFLPGVGAASRRKQVFNLDIDVWLRLSRRSQHLKTLPALKFEEKERRRLHNMCAHSSTYVCIVVVVLCTYLAQFFFGALKLA